MKNNNFFINTVLFKTFLIKFSVLVLSLVALNANNSLANDLSSLIKQCSACHGKNGISANNSWPNLAGQKQGYLIKELQAFRDQQRSDPLMSPIAKNLSDDDIKQLAQYYSKQNNNSKVQGPVNTAGQHVRARCISCLGMHGFTVTDLWPNLAGQKSDYLEKQLLAFKEGSRKSPIMEVIANELTMKQIKNVAIYYSQVPAKE